MKKYLLALILGFGIVFQCQLVYAQMEDTTAESAINTQTIDKNILADAELMKTITPEQLEEYIAKGADVNAVAVSGNMRGATVLAIASFLSMENSKLEIIKTLIKAGANVNQKMMGRTTLLPLIIENTADIDNPEIVKVLLDYGANVEAENDSGWTPLMLAVEYRNSEYVKMLIDAGANVNAKVIRYPSYGSGWTPLMIAVKSGDIEKVNILIDAGADLHAVAYGETVMDFAYKQNNSKIIKLLENAGIIEDQDKKIQRIIDSTELLITLIRTFYNNADNYEGLTTLVAHENRMIPDYMENYMKINIETSDAINKGDNKAFIVQLNELWKGICVGIATSDLGNHVKFATKKSSKFLYTPFSIQDARESCDCEEDQCTIFLKVNK